MKKIEFAGLFVFFVFGLFTGCNGVKNIRGVQGSGNLKTETRNVTGFKKIKAESAMNLEISVQKNFALTVETDDNLLEHIKTEVSGDTLTIAVKDSISSKAKTNVKISLPELTDLNISGASEAVITDVKTDSLKLNVSGASRVRVGGEVKSIDANASGASGIDAENLKTENAEADASGASNITISPTGELNAEASGASSIYYTGEPKNIKQNASGASSVKKK